MTASAQTLTDPRPAFAAASATALATVAGVRPGLLDRPTPCTEYDLRALLGHLVSVFRRVAAVGRGEPPASVPQVTTDVPDDGWAAAARAAADEALAVWADDALLDRELVLPYGRHRGAVAMATYTGEVTTHTWDVAVTSGQTPAWDPDVLAVALAATHRMLPADGRGERIPFGAVVPVPADAPLVEQVVAWQGRDPRWTP
ncbi:TIGR03086 family metal-binding protein [Blastococcus sp. URHD0036]|uniref:TIGR03086 family metal-binding protein n=1 Tax=Blastococcus sp. URHD0036 TaxID=1380356 RepID=UPI0004952558|nr:TIGR03086 family metal-binding protein [Blastococcus sp. URHD0036]